MSFQKYKRFEPESLDDLSIKEIELLARSVRKDILTMTSAACSGHPGGSLSSTDIFLMLWSCADINPESTRNPSRDRIVVSHGHTSAAVYSVLGQLGYLDRTSAIQSFRRGNSLFEGHPNAHVNGVEWCSGSLGQGLSVGCGFALASRLTKRDYHVFVVMGDGEQEKGQITEAREFAAKYDLVNLTAIIDLNRLQASGSTRVIMPSDIEAKYRASGWEVLKCSGHDYKELYQALGTAYHNTDTPVAIIAETVMGKGVSFIENAYEYHGTVLKPDQLEKALTELEGNADINDFAFAKKTTIPWVTSDAIPIVHEKDKSCFYPHGSMVECRSAAGTTVYNLIKENPDTPIVAVDCDLVESVKIGKVLKEFPDKLIECGIQEHNAVSLSGALSKSGVIPFYFDFGVFALDETFGQHRMNSSNETSVKVIATHCGLDVGEDGKTHQCIDYISLVNSLTSYKLIIPADANQMVHAVRYAASIPGNVVIATGRSKVPVLSNTNGEPLFADGYSFRYGKADWVCDGGDGTIITTGTMVHRAAAAHDKLLTQGIRVGVLNVSCPQELTIEEVTKAAQTGFIITYEDHLVTNGLGSIVGTRLMENGIVCQFKRIGITHLGKSCSPEEQYKFQKMDTDSLVEEIQNSKRTISLLKR